MTTKERDSISKFLSLVLRHKPEKINLKLNAEGWADTGELLQKMNISIEDLQEVVSTNDKKRFVFSEDMSLIKANQGHSIQVDLNLEPAAPPQILYHGTAERNIASIFKEGLQKQQRHHVHLSADADTALNVGKRYGKPVVLQVAAEKMSAKGHLFYRTENNVWLTDAVAPEYIEITA